MSQPEVKRRETMLSCPLIIFYFCFSKDLGLHSSDYQRSLLQVVGELDIRFIFEQCQHYVVISVETGIMQGSPRIAILIVDLRFQVPLKSGVKEIVYFFEIIAFDTLKKFRVVLPFFLPFQRFRRCFREK